VIKRAIGAKIHSTLSKLKEIYPDEGVPLEMVFHLRCDAGGDAHG
jgi:hypothetical protein